MKIYRGSECGISDGRVGEIALVESIINNWDAWEGCN